MHSRPVLFFSFFIAIAFFSLGSPTLNCALAGGDDFVVGIESMPETLDPRLAGGVYGQRIVQQLLYEMLIDQDEHLKINPSLAERWETPSPLIYRFYLRKDVKFSDGSLLNAQDVLYTFQSLMSDNQPTRYVFLKKKIKSIRIIDDYTLEFDLTEPQASFLTALFVPIFKFIAVSADNKTQPLGTGAFIIAEAKPTQLILKSNPNYREGEPAMKRVIFKLVKDDQTRFLKLKKKDLDFVVNALPDDKIKFFQMSPLNQTYRVVETPGLSYQYLGFNLDFPLLQNKAIRQAIAYGINREEIIQYFKKYHAVIAQGLLTQVNEFTDQSIKPYEYNPKRALELLEAAGFPDINGVRLTLEYKTTTSRDAIYQAKIIQSQLKQIGIHLVIRSLEWGTFFADVQKGNFQIFSLRWIGVSDPDFYFDIFHSSQMPPAGLNRVRYSNADLDNLLSSGRIESNVAQRKIIFNQVQQLLNDQLPYVSLWHNNFVAIIKSDIEGFVMHPAGGFQSFKHLKRLK